MKILPTITSIYSKVTISIFVLCITGCILGSILIFFSGKEIVERSSGQSFVALAKETGSKLELLIEHHLEEALSTAEMKSTIQLVKESNARFDSMSDGEKEAYITKLDVRWTSDNMDKAAYLENSVSEMLTRYISSTNDLLSSFENPLENNSAVLHETVFVTNRDGVVVAATKPPLRAYYGDDPEWLRAFNFGDGKISLSEIYFEDKYNSYVFTMQVPIKVSTAKGRKTIGLVHMVHNAGPFFRWVTNIRLGKTDHTMLVSSEGVIIYCPVLPVKTHRLDPSVNVEMTRRMEGWVKSAKDVHFAGTDSINGFSIIPITKKVGANSVFAIGNFGGKPLFIFTSQNPRETYEPLIHFLKYVGTFGGIGILLFTLIGLVSTRRLIRPLMELKESATRIGDGNYELWIDIHRSDEIGDLAVAFNQMAKKLKTSYAGLEEISNMKSEFVSKVSHELRTPLTSIKSFSEILLLYKDINEKTQKEFLEIIHSESSRLARLINDVLDLSKIESGAFQLKTMELKLPGIIDFSVSILTAWMKEKNIKLVLDIEKNLPSIFGDRDQIIQVLDNLVSNAVKFTKTGGRITVSAKKYGDGFVLVSVKDTGVGISADDMEYVFQAFFQSGSHISGELKGTGLGLNICKEIIPNLGGDIWCESELGEGSTFMFTLPIARPSKVLIENIKEMQGTSGSA